MTKIKFIICIIIFGLFSACLEKDELIKEISNKELLFLKEAADYIISKKMQNEKLDSFVISKEFDYFASSRFSKTEENRINLPKNIEDEINTNFFRKKNTKLEKISASKKSAKVLTFSGFSEKYLIITFRDLNKEQIIESEIATKIHKISNTERFFLIEKTEKDFHILAESEISFN